MRSYDVSIDFGTSDSDLEYLAFGKNKEVEKAINSLNLAAVASLTTEIVKLLYESYIGKPYTGPDKIGTLSQFVRDMATINFWDENRYEKEFLD